MFNLYKNAKIDSIAFSDGQILTGDNEKYIRFIWEVSAPTISKTGNWMFHAKGGDFRRWAGNLNSVVAWDKKSIEHYKKDKIARFPKDEILFRKGITWNLISSYPVFCTRLLTEEQTFNKAAATLLFYNDEKVEYTLAFTNTKIATKLMRMLNPTLNNNIKDVLALPFIYDKDKCGTIIPLVEENITISNGDWDVEETSWNFKKHPLI